MGKGHITKAKVPKREAALIVDDIDLDIVRQPLLFQLAPNESSGERCCVKRYIKISSKIGNGADMILMPMRENDAEQIVATLLNESQIGKDQVDAGIAWIGKGKAQIRTEENTSELQSLMSISSAVFCFKKKNNNLTNTTT